MAEPGDTPDLDVRATEDEHSSGGVARRPVTIVRGNGARMWDADGHEYIDCASAHGWAHLGHGHPDVVAAIQRQSEELIALTESAYNPHRAVWFRELRRVLASPFPSNGQGTLSRIHPCNSGAEAVEAALKFARYHTGRTAFVALRGGFHGRTLGALSVTSSHRYQRPFEPLVPGVTHVDLNDLAAADAAVGDDTAGVIIELIQGEGGVKEINPDFAAGVQQLCRDRGALLIVDEVQTGFGRTGRWFASEHWEVHPDVLVLGKALGAGIPMGAAVWRSGLSTFEPGLHGSTFGGAPLACAASVAGMRVLERDALADRAAALGSRVIEALATSAESGTTLARSVRGRGLMIGVELRGRVTPVLRELMMKGVWALPAGKNVLRLLPPLTIAEDDLTHATNTIVEVLSRG